MILIGAMAVCKVRKAGAPALHLLLAGLLVLIGVGTAVFHITLKYSGQMADEILMMLSLLLCLVCLLEAARGKSNSIVRLVALVYGLGFSMLHYANGFTDLFQAHVAVLIVGFCAGVTFILFVSPDTYSFARSSVQLKREFGSYVSVLLLAVLAWAADENLCETLQAIPFGNPQFHAWWHVLVATAYYKGTMLCGSIREELHPGETTSNYIPADVQGIIGLKGFLVQQQSEVSGSRHGLDWVKDDQSFPRFRGTSSVSSSTRASDSSY